MPKTDVVRRIDQLQPAAVPGTQVQPLVVGGGNADTVDGFHASAVRRANALIALDGNGYLPRNVIPLLGDDQAFGHSGMQYIGPTAMLAEAIATDTDIILVTAPVFQANTRAVIGHYTVPYEVIIITGAAVASGPYWSYSVLRAQSGFAAQTFPRGSEVIGIGRLTSGGYLLMSSGTGVNSPFLDAWENAADTTITWRARFGRLSGVPADFKAVFPDSLDWNTFGLAADNVFLRGGIYAQYGNIAGDLDVSGTLTVKDSSTNARLEMGDTAAGWGIAVRNDEGRPVWAVITPYADESGNVSDAAWFVDTGTGERTIYYRQESGAWRLTLGDWEVSADKLSGGTLEWGNGAGRMNADGLTYIYDASNSFGIVSTPYITVSINSSNAYGPSLSVSHNHVAITKAAIHGASWLGNGVEGESSNDGWGVYGLSHSGWGVFGQSDSGEGVTGWSDTGDAIYSGGTIKLLEVSAPSAPPASHARLYVQDNGSGKMQLCVRFPTGAVQVLANEP